MSLQLALPTASTSCALAIRILTRSMHLSISSQLNMIDKHRPNKDSFGGSDARFCVGDCHPPLDETSVMVWLLAPERDFQNLTDIADAADALDGRNAD